MDVDQLPCSVVDESELERRIRETYGVECAAVVYAQRKVWEAQAGRRLAMETILYQTEFALSLANNYGAVCPVA